MDAALPITATRWRIGVDVLIGLIPGVGDDLTSTVSFHLVIRGLRLNIVLTVIMRMIWNIILDLVLGSLSLIGDLFDLSFKANLRNMALLKKALNLQKKC